MALRKYSKSHHSTMNELNLTPLLDLAFVLLVIFIISTAPMVNDLDLNLPSKSKAQKAPPKRPNFLIVEANGQVLLNGEDTPPRLLLPTLKKMKRQDPDTTVVVHGDSAVKYQNMVSVFDALQQADVQKVGLATDRLSAAMMNPPQTNSPVTPATP